jgi:hypothetical protein
VWRKSATGRRRLVARLAAVTALALCCRGWAGTGVADNQLWSELDALVALSSDFSVTAVAQLRLSEDLPNPTLAAAGADVSYRNGDWTLAAGYRGEISGNRVVGRSKTQLALMMASWRQRFGRSEFDLRARLEDTLGAAGNPYRARLRAEYRWNLPRAGLVSYVFVNDEGFYRIAGDEWYQNRAQGGTDLALGARTDLRLYYQRQDSRDGRPRASNALGLLMVVALR